ncbi:MAG: PhzF family phenazine biosynthesis protein, partial [Schwartzia sp.]|nr:PhzF family phenazine biosynthesis protein [Schwartzia sp. (in: firmicutes)]
MDRVPSVSTARRTGVKMKQYVVDAFTEKPFSGNPAAVCVTEETLPEDFMRNLAAENGLSETAFLVREGDGWRLRWFTPGTEVDLCGHATLASSFVMLNYYEKEKESVRFYTKSGTLTVVRRDGRYEMDFPLTPQREIPVTNHMEAAYGVRPVKALLGKDLVCVFADEKEV